MKAANNNFPRQVVSRQQINGRILVKDNCSCGVICCQWVPVGGDVCCQDCSDAKDRAMNGWNPANSCD